MKTEYKVSSGQLCCCIHLATIMRWQWWLEYLGIQSWADHCMSLWASMCSTVLLFSVWSSVPVGLSRGSMQVNASMSHPRTTGPLPRCPQLPHSGVCLQLPSSESKWSRVGADKGAEEDRRSRHPLPRALAGISAVLLPRVCQWEPPDEWAHLFSDSGDEFVCQRASEQEGLCRAEDGMNGSRTLPVPGELPECSLSLVRGDWPPLRV